jgi:hypothetical protein
VRHPAFAMIALTFHADVVVQILLDQPCTMP